jgi:hypothetical protein
MLVLSDHGRAPATCTTGALYDVVAPRKNMSRPAGEWNQVRITAKGDRIRIEINGEEVVDHEGDRRRRGHIGLQVHDERSTVRFRHIRVREL